MARSMKEVHTINYYSINEGAARRAKEMNSFSDYKEGSATAEYRAMVDKAAAIAEQQKSRVDPMYHEKIDHLLDTYARKLAENMNQGFAIDARVPSVMIAGPANFPVGKKEKQNRARDSNMEEWRYIQGLLDKIRSTGMGGISADDPAAIEKLQKKLDGLERSQLIMKEVNAYYRKHGKLDGCALLSPDQIEKLKASMASSWRSDPRPFESYQLTNNNAEIRRVKTRIEQLSKQAQREFSGWEFDGGRVEMNREDNRLQVFFDGKPDADTRAELKSSGFRWAPSVGAWQIHCHIYYNSTTLDCTRKFRNFWGSSFALRRLSDRLCLENGLSIVENPKPRSKSKYRNYGEWQKDRKGPLSYQDRLRLAIDTALAERPADLDEFLNLMKRAGYEVKTVRGGGISFRLTGQGQERFTRLRASTLGDGYDLQDVLSAIEGKEKRPGRSERKISLAVDIQAKLAAGKGPGYERWAKVFNIKQMAAALAYIQDNNLTDYEQLAKKATEAADRFHVISEQVKQTEQAMKTNAGLKAATVQYAKTRPVFEQYKATKYSRKFLAEHEADLELYRAAQAEMRSLLGGAKLPKMDVLKEEGRKLTAKKKQLYGEYQKARRDMQEIVTIKANIDTLMGYTEPGRKQEKER